MSGMVRISGWCAKTKLNVYREDIFATFVLFPSFRKLDVHSLLFISLISTTSYFQKRW